MSEKTAGSTEPPALRLLNLEQSEFERFLHDELGQSLVAIRSMASALEDESQHEISTMIAQVADDAYVEVYDRMMELRAESLAHGPVLANAIHQCIDEARLEARGLAYRLNLDDGVELLTDPVYRRLLLRCLRCIVLAVKRTADTGGELVIDIGRDGNRLTLSVQPPPGDFAATLYRHPRIERLATRVAEFGGKLEQQQPPQASLLRVCLPGYPRGAG